MPITAVVHDPDVRDWTFRTHQTLQDLGVNSNRALRVTDHGINLDLREIEAVVPLDTLDLDGPDLPCWLVQYTVRGRYTDTCVPMICWAPSAVSAALHVSVVELHRGAIRVDLVHRLPPTLFR